jgi:hypothetical protein
VAGIDVLHRQLARVFLVTVDALHAGYVYTATAADVAIAADMACALAQASRGLTNRRCDPARSDHAVTQDGALAEVAFRRMIGLPIDYRINTFATYDVRLPDGRRVDVKGTRHLHGRLLSRTARDCDLFVLLALDGWCCTFCGWAARADLLSPANRWNPGHGECFALPQDRLERTLIWTVPHGSTDSGVDTREHDRANHQAAN